jgi:NIMA (never in mitosis gene a)-related kinase 1/4/5
MDKLKQIKLLGEGAFGKCYLCEHPDNGSKYVVKQIDISRMTPQEKKEAYHEAKVMSAFDHPNIIKFIDVYTTTNGKLNIVMNYADGGDLSSKISQQRGRLFSENEILDLFVQVLLAMKHVHDRKVLHRDIKGQNIFLMKSGLIKLGDFGISKVLSNTVEKARTMVGTPYYLSPEIVENRPYSFKSDIWSLGVLLYELCTLKPPFDGTSIRHLGLNIVRGIYPPPPPHYSRDLKMLIAQMLTVDSNRRPTVAQILRMPFIKSRIQNLLSESTRFEEFSHTILHKQGLFEAKKNENSRPDSKPDQKKVEVKNLLNQIMEEKKEIPKLEYKNFVNNEKKPEIKKELPKPEPKREPPKPEVRDFQVMQDKAPNPRFKVVEVKKMDEDKKPAEVKPNRYEIPKFQDIKKPEQPAYRPEPVRNEIPKNQDIKRPEPPAFRPEPIYKPVPPKAPIMQGRLEDIFKPVDKPQVKKPDPVRAQAQDELRKKKEQEARKKLEELMQKRENEKLEEVQRKEAAEKKRQEKMKKIQEERAKMMQDIKQKKFNKGESQVIVKPLEPLISNDPDPQPLSLETRKSDFNDTKSSKEKPKYAENRQKMLEALRQKKSNQPQENFVIEWVGIRNPEERRLYEVLQEAITETSSNDEDPIYITQIPNTEEEEIIDRIDEIADKEVVIVENQINPTETEDNEYDFDFNYNSLEAMRMLVEEKMGCELLFEAYKVMKNMGDIDPLEVGYTIFYEKLSGILPKSNLEEYVSYLRTLMIFENKAENP